MTTEELLNEMEREAELHSEETPVCVIDPETRTITVPSEYQLLGVENDKRVERIHFQCPKIVGDNKNLTQFSVRVNYRNANGETDQYICHDIEEAEDGYVTFSWELWRKVTKYKGTVNFIVCAVKAEEDGTITNEWNTTLAQSEVLEGLEVEEPVFTEEEKDVVVQLLNMVKKTTEDAVKEIQDTVSGLELLIGENAGSHNSIYRGKNLGTQVTDAQYQAIQAGTFDDLYIGDYWTIGGVNWRIAAFDYYYNTGDTAFTKHHAVIVPDTSLYTHVMNDTNITTGAYVGSKMYTEGLDQAKTTINNAFGSSHVLSHRIYLSNATSNGRASAGVWMDSTVDLMCEHMVYGSGIFSPVSDGSTVPNNYRVEKSQLPLFAHNPTMIGIRSTWWLRDVITSAYFANVNYTGAAYSLNASDVNGVRPAFCIGI